jgi:hypothetical protein
MASMEKQMTNHTEQIIKASLVVSNYLGEMLDQFENHIGDNDEMLDAMDALWYAIEAYKVATAHEKLVANG